MACGVANSEAVEIICSQLADIVTVSDDEVAAAMRAVFDDTHNVAEGAGAAGVAAILKAKGLSGKRVATILSGGNVDREVFASVLRG
jgi:threonine dehydratase